MSEDKLLSEDGWMKEKYFPSSTIQSVRLVLAAVLMEDMALLCAMVKFLVHFSLRTSSKNASFLVLILISSWT